MEYVSPSCWAGWLRRVLSINTHSIHHLHHTVPTQPHLSRGRYYRQDQNKSATHLYIVKNITDKYLRDSWEIEGRLTAPDTIRKMVANYYWVCYLFISMEYTQWP
jgi:fatty-acid desaturase